MAGIDEYRSGLRSAVRGFWNGALTASQFESEVRSAINRRLTQAFEEGAKECGLAPDEFTETEFLAMGRGIQEELSYLDGFTEAIEEQSKANGGLLEPLLSRVELWTNRYRDFQNRAKTMACSDKKLVWQIGPTESHCRDCSGYNGRVYRGSVWEKNGIRPQSPGLACKGIRCKCQLIPTDARLTSGKPPRMSG